jgi:hypothetical protein
MAKLLDVSQQGLFHLQIGKSKPRTSQLQAIAAVSKIGKKQ